METPLPIVCLCFFALEGVIQPTVGGRKLALPFSHSQHSPPWEGKQTFLLCPWKCLMTKPPTLERETNVKLLMI